MLALWVGGLVVLGVGLCVVGCAWGLFRVGVVVCVGVWLLFSCLLGLGPWLCVFCHASCFTSVGVACSLLRVCTECCGSPAFLVFLAGHVHYFMVINQLLS